MDQRAVAEVEDSGLVGLLHPVDHLHDGVAVLGGLNHHPPGLLVLLTILNGITLENHVLECEYVLVI